MGWLNSDDILLPGSLNAIGEFFAKNPEVLWVTGQPSAIHTDGTWKLHQSKSWSRLRMLSGDYRWIQQESTFWRRSLWDLAGGALSLEYDLAFDFDLWLRFFRHAELFSYEMPLGAFRYRVGQRSREHLDLYEAQARLALEKEYKELSDRYRSFFSIVLPDQLTSIDSLEATKRERSLSISDRPVITPETLLDMPEVPREHTAGPPSLDSLYDFVKRSDDLTAFKDAHTGERCFIIGNGPSLNSMDLSLLEDEVTFGCNSLFLLFDRISWRPTYYTCVDSRVLPDRADDIDAMLAQNSSITAFFPATIKEHIDGSETIATRTIIPPAAGRFYFNERPNSLSNLPYSMFSYDINDHIVQPYTVAITMLQLATYMGFSEIYLIGCDTDYKVPDDAVRERMPTDMGAGLALTSMSDNDPNHFHPEYFGKGRKWHDPQTEKMVQHHIYAKEAGDILGVRIFNATNGGKLEVYPRLEFNLLFSDEERARQPSRKLPARPVSNRPLGYSVEVRPRAGSAWYSESAHAIERVSPFLFRLLRSVRRGLLPTAENRMARWMIIVLVCVILFLIFR